MIFVTVGTHEQQFDRLLKEIDSLCEKGIITEQVVAQTGFSDYEPKFCTWNKLLRYPDMVKYVNEARIIITHGGPSSIIMPLQVGKIPIVVPRKLEYGEHINNHQVNFVHSVGERYNNIIIVDDTSDLERVITEYDEIIKGMTSGIRSNNEEFCRRFDEIVQGLDIHK